MRLALINHVESHPSALTCSGIKWFRGVDMGIGNDFSSSLGEEATGINKPLRSRRRHIGIGKFPGPIVFQALIDAIEQPADNQHVIHHAD